MVAVRGVSSKWNASSDSQLPPQLRPSSARHASSRTCSCSSTTTGFPENDQFGTDKDVKMPTSTGTTATFRLVEGVKVSEGVKSGRVSAMKRIQRLRESSAVKNCDPLRQDLRSIFVRKRNKEDVQRGMYKDFIDENFDFRPTAS